MSAEFESLSRAAHRPVDFSQGFVDRVRRLGDDVGDAIGSSLQHDADMNYRPGQMLLILLTNHMYPTQNERSAQLLMKIAVSSRGPYWAVLLFEREQDGWSPRELRAFASRRLATTVAEISRVMEEQGLSRIDDELLNRELPGMITQLDGAPATVRDVFFCEIC